MELSLTQLKPKQIEAFRFLTSRNASFLIADMGEGKTIISLCTIKYWLDLAKVRRVLILAPLDVVRLTWPMEIQKWKELADLDYVVLRGSPRKRTALLEENHSVYLLNYENFPWLLDSVGREEKNPFDAVFYDESIKMASISNRRFKMWKPYFSTFKYRVALSAKPRPNTVQSLYGQVYLLDSGKTFGHNFQNFRMEYCYPGYSKYVWIDRPEANDMIYEKIKSFCFRLKGEVSEYALQDIEVTLPHALQQKYNILEKKMILQHKNGDTPLNTKVVAVGKCCQFVGGYLYIDSDRLDSKGNPVRKTLHVHAKKTQALVRLIKNIDVKGGILIAYQYQHEREGIRKALPEVVIFNEGDKQEILDKWNRGEIRYLAIHPATAGHGLNLQYGGSTLIWYTLPWSLDQYEQTVGRINRPGQKNPVTIYRILVLKTIDVVKKEILRHRKATQEDFLKIIELYWQTKTAN